jgi:DNA sulfur modification protein DndE
MGHVNYIYLDFKGLRQDDVKELENFLLIQKQFFDCPQTPFPVNRLHLSNNVNEQSIKYGN